jgi:transposase
LDARIGRDGPFAHFSNSGEGIEQLSAFCREHGAELVVMEATGGYEKQPFALLWEHGVPAAIVNPRAVRDFAKAMGRLEKTDRIDAGVIAWFAQTKHVKPMPLASDVQTRLKALVTRLRQLTEHRVVHVQQRTLVTEPFIEAGFDEMLALLARQIRALEVEIASLISADPLWSKLDEAFRSIKGVADRTVARLMAELPEIGLISNKAIAKLVGLAPLADDSGNSEGTRSIRGGRSTVREILFVVADIARRYDPKLEAFRERLLLKGKKKKVVRIALAHKLLVWLNAKARDARKAFAMAE